MGNLASDTGEAKYMNDKFENNHNGGGDDLVV